MQGVATPHPPRTWPTLRGRRPQGGRADGPSQGRQPGRPAWGGHSLRGEALATVPSPLPHPPALHGHPARGSGTNYRCGFSYVVTNAECFGIEDDPTPR